ncbi:MAG: hypothetical protein HQ523_00585 [Lentisphaerae bacterium]|nr:hypothetical protein [Lentisphaerota bacterium]
MDRWLWGYLESLRRRPRAGAGTRHLIVAICDHYEPYRDQASQTTARAYVDRWATEYPTMAAEFRDADGCMPRHTFFYPEEEYDPVCMAQLGTLMQQGCGEVEIHLHHRNDTPEGLREKLVRFRDLLHRAHGMLGETGINRGGHRDTEERSSVAYAFIHGNWSLCNSRPDRDWCGVNEELGILAETGCYADLTFPSAPSPTQPRMVNAIYRASDQPEGCGHDRGVRVKVKGEKEEHPTSNTQHPTSKELLLVQGPLGLDLGRRKWGVLPRLENAELSGANPPTPGRAGLWARTGIHVEGRPEWIFAKLHTHGCVPKNSDVLLGEPIRAMHRQLQRQYNDGTAWQLHYVTAREMVNMIRAAEDGCTDSPGHCRDYAINQPPAMQS